MRIARNELPSYQSRPSGLRRLRSKERKICMSKLCRICDKVWTLRNLFQTPSGASLVRWRKAHCSLHIAHWALLIGHCSLGIAHFGMDLARLRSLQVDPLLDESIEL